MSVVFFFLFLFCLQRKHLASVCVSGRRLTVSCQRLTRFLLCTVYYFVVNRYTFENCKMKRECHVCMSVLIALFDLRDPGYFIHSWFWNFFFLLTLNKLLNFKRCFMCVFHFSVNGHFWKKFEDETAKNQAVWLSTNASVLWPRWLFS